MTIKEALSVTHRSVSYREAEILLQAVLKADRSWLYSHGDQILTDEEFERYEGYLQRREINEPVAYILGFKEFYSRPFQVDKRALIPRPESEKLVDLALDFLPKRFTSHLLATNKPCPVRILELGTGCGNLAITLALELAVKPTPAEIIATDISEEALGLAQDNWQQLPADSSANKPRFVVADLFAHPEIEQHKPYDLIIANLPYVENRWKFSPEAQPEVVFQEPDIALFGGDDGLDIYRRFFKEVSAYLYPEGVILIEFGETQTSKLKEIAQAAFPDWHLMVYPDYAGLDRVLEIKKLRASNYFSR